MSCSFPNFDYGIDMTVHHIWRQGRRYAESGYRLDVQAKSTSGAVVAESFLQYDLPVKNYDDFRNLRAGCPRLLVLLVLPDQESLWTEQTEEHLLLRHAAYWLSLKGHEAVPNSRTVRIVIPRENFFTVTALQALMQRVRRRQPL